MAIYPATHFVTNDPAVQRSLVEIQREMDERCAWFEDNGKVLEAHRLRQRTHYDMEMLREMGYCNGIENYSRILLGKQPGATPNCLLDYFPDDFLCFIDESHMTLPQIRGMYEGDRSRKRRWWTTASACPAPSTTGRCASTSSWPRCRRSCS